MAGTKREAAIPAETKGVAERILAEAECDACLAGGRSSATEGAAATGAEA